MNHCDGMTIASYDKKVFEADIGLKYYNTKYINEYGKYQKLFMYEPHITGEKKHLFVYSFSDLSVTFKDLLVTIL